MTTQKNDETMQDVLKKQAWIQLSNEFQWTEALLEKYHDKVDWDEVSENTDIQWTIPMIRKFSNNLNWSVFTKTIAKGKMNLLFLETFKDCWDWQVLSERSEIGLTHEILMKYADRWNWEKLIRCHFHRIFDQKGIDFYEKYKEYIPEDKLQGSSLWYEMINQKERELLNDLIS